MVKYVCVISCAETPLFILDVARSMPVHVACMTMTVQGKYCVSGVYLGIYPPAGERHAC